MLLSVFRVKFEMTNLDISTLKVMLETFCDPYTVGGISQFVIADTMKQSLDYIRKLEEEIDDIYYQKAFNE